MLITPCYESIISVILLGTYMETNAESEWWLPESGLDPEKIDLNIKGTTAKSIKNQYYLARYLPVLFTLTSIIGMIIVVPTEQKENLGVGEGLFDTILLLALVPLMLFTLFLTAYRKEEILHKKEVKMVYVSREEGMEIHYTDGRGIEEILRIQLGAISSVHQWVEVKYQSGGGDGDQTIRTESRLSSIVTKDDQHMITGSKKQIRQLCEILELELKTFKPR
tara:strand:- start:3384 stop:4049 length:666 start_codon:yes stop_codon:yes gene_type:complete